MSAKIIMILVGFVLIGIALIGIAKKEKAMSYKLGIPIIILGVILVIYASYSSDLVNYNTQIEQVSTGNKLKVEGPVNAIKVISPIDKDSVDCRILTMGVYPKSHKNDIWVLIRPTDNRYYPQSDHTNTSYKRDGEWQVVTRFGGDLGEAYDLIVYETDTKTSKFFSTTIQKWKDEDNYPGLKLEEIPEGAKEVDRIKIYTGKNCRGVF